MLGISGAPGWWFTGLAFEDDPGLEAAAKLGILVASVVAAIIGSLVLARGRPSPVDL